MGKGVYETIEQGKKGECMTGLIIGQEGRPLTEEEVMDVRVVHGAGKEAGVDARGVEGDLFSRMFPGAPPDFGGLALAPGADHLEAACLVVGGNDDQGV